MLAEAWRGDVQRHLKEGGQLLWGIFLALEDEARCRQVSLRRDAPRWQPASWLEVRGANHRSALRSREKVGAWLSGGSGRTQPLPL